MDAVIIIMIIWFALVSLVTFIFFDEGTKGVEKEPYYGRKTGKMYTAKSSRKDYIL
jgi:hypothetical protein